MLNVVIIAKRVCAIGECLCHSYAIVDVAMGRDHSFSVFESNAEFRPVIMFGEFGV